jgi:hypothetical protein
MWLLIEMIEKEEKLGLGKAKVPLARSVHVSRFYARVKDE